MKKLILAMLVFAIFLPVKADNVKVVISDGLSDGSLKSKVEARLSGLMTEINNACDAGRDINMKNVVLTDAAQRSLSMLWENSHFRCTDKEVVERCIETNSGYQIRNIPLMMVSGEDGDEYQEAVISFSKNGDIESFYLTISNNLYMDVVRGNLELTDLRRRQLILDYVERFRTSYNQKDLAFLQQVFSDDALIITGKVIRASSKDGMKLPEKIIYTKNTKEEYLTKLKSVFSANKYIHVVFDEIKVRRHPVNPNFYGVTLHQGYTSSSYHDDGYVFLLWDFTNEDLPLIHVRTWQPDQFQGDRIPESEVFSLADFDI